MFSTDLTLPLGIEIRAADWSRDEPAIATVRRRVFIDEQHVPETMEWEGIDPACDWFVAALDGQVVGIARLTAAGRIGRMAVLPDWRGRGLGSALLTAILGRAGERGLAQVELHAQTHAAGFYQGFGFAPVGPEFEEAGIPHRHMTLDLRGFP